LGGLHQLVNFCTERWAHEVTRRGGTRPTFSFTLADGTVRKFTGGFRVHGRRKTPPAMANFMRRLPHWKNGCAC
jgi:hypothetical protein